MVETPKRVDPGANAGVGDVLANKYRIDEILGHGAVGVVAKCMHLQLNETVAIKMLRKDVLIDHETLERFTLEARAAAKLRSEYAARVIDVGVFDNGVPYMVMEFLEGQDLGQLIAENKSFAPSQVVEWILQAAEALAEAHSIDVVHRDVKPSNLFVTMRPDGSAHIKVLDFGISKAPLGLDLRLTQTQALLGTPAYMSPEQMRSASAVDQRSDIWSLGIVMYELIEGDLPFVASSFSELVLKVSCDPPARMVNTPPALQRVLLRCLEKSPEQRYANMAELGRDLVPFAPDRYRAALIVDRMSRLSGRRTPVEWTGNITPRTPKIDLDRLPSGPVTVPNTDDLATAPREKVALRPSRRRVALLAVVALGAAALAVALLIARLTGRPAHQAAIAAPADSQIRVEPIETAPIADAMPATAVVAPTPEAVPPPPIQPAAAKPTPPRIIKRPATTKKRPPADRESPPCDVYVNPYGCPK